MCRTDGQMREMMGVAKANIWQPEMSRILVEVKNCYCVTGPLLLADRPQRSKVHVPGKKR
jgi:hypothetical protein